MDRSYRQARANLIVKMRNEGNGYKRIGDIVGVTREQASVIYRQEIKRRVLQHLQVGNGMD